MTVSGLTMTTAARHSVQTRESYTHSRRSAWASRSRGGRPVQHLQLVPQREYLKLQRGA